MITVLSSADGLVLFKISFIIIVIIIIIHKSNNFLDYDWFKKLFSTNLLAKLLSDSSISQSHSKL